MESMNLLDITIRYFNVIVFILCVVFGSISLFASWIAWREVQKNRNMIRSIIAAYNIAEDAVEKGREHHGEFQLDPAITLVIFNTLQEILNSMYGELTGKPIPSLEERSHGSKRKSLLNKLGLKKLKGKFREDEKVADPAILHSNPEHQEHSIHS